MRYDANVAAMYEWAIENDNKIEIETELQNKIIRLVSRFNEKELKLVLGYVNQVYLVSDAYEMDKIYEKYRREQKAKAKKEVA